MLLRMDLLESRSRTKLKIYYSDNYKITHSNFPRPPETEHDDYQVMFYDNYYAEGYAPPLPVPQRYVLDFKDKKRK